MAVEDRIVDRLQAELNRAKQAFDRAKEDFWRVAAAAPSGLPHPDGTQQVHNAARAHMHAMNTYTKALKRFNEYLLNGTIPEDLRSEFAGKTAAGSQQPDSNAGKRSA